LANTFPPFPSDLRFGSYLVYPNRRATEQAADPSAANACRNPGIPDRVILIDDVVTRGSMFSGAYARLDEVLEGAEIVAAFAFARTVPTFTGAVDACVGRIACNPAGTHCTRTP
jgi:hypothetical protein